MPQDYEERQLRWEHREVELERQIATLERQTAQIAGAAAKVRESGGLVLLVVNIIHVHRHRTIHV